MRAHQFSTAARCLLCEALSLALYFVPLALLAQSPDPASRLLPPRHRLLGSTRQKGHPCSDRHSHQRSADELRDRLEAPGDKSDWFASPGECRLPGLRSRRRRHSQRDIVNATDTARSSWFSRKARPTSGSICSRASPPSNRPSAMRSRSLMPCSTHTRMPAPRRWAPRSKPVRRATPRLPTRRLDPDGRPVAGLATRRGGRGPGRLRSGEAATAHDDGEQDVARVSFEPRVVRVLVLRRGGSDPRGV
jgi:hypothetical protein